MALRRTGRKGAGDPGAAPICSKVPGEPGRSDAKGEGVFTGLVEATGRLERRERRGPGYRLSVATDLGPLELGESISVSGACLTVAKISPGGFDADVSAETVDKTTLGDAHVGERVNLERSLRLGDRLGGHLVTGHVDAVARVASVAPAGEALRVSIEPPLELLRLLAPKGSVALDGVSLTINATRERQFEVMLIPHTVQVTSLEGISPGRRLNLEVDLLSRYVAHYLTRSDSSDGGLAAVLERAGLSSPR